MAHKTQNVEAPYLHLRREQPWLYSYNRRIRHVHGITIRNLSLSKNRPRRQTIDDDAVPSAHKSPAKMLVQREKKLEHSRSSSELRSIHELHTGKEDEEPSIASDGSPRGKGTPRPAYNRLRRRSTMDWSGASPLTRQKKLEDVAENRLLDCFFSLHVDGVDGPIYVSEVSKKAMNPNFRLFSLEDSGPSITRRSEMTVKLWAKHQSITDYQYILELHVELPSLQFIGKSLESFRHPLPSNCVLFHLDDGIYTSFTDLSLPAGTSFSGAKTQTSRTLPTSSYDALMRLSTLDDCIQDALVTRQQLTNQINTILESNKSSISTVTQAPEAELRFQTLNDAVANEKRRVEAAQKRRDEKVENLRTRREAMAKGRAEREVATHQLDAAKDPLQAAQSTVLATSEKIVGQRRRVCEDILTIFPIDPIPGRSLQFTIRGISLPHSNFDDASISESSIAAALGYVAQIVQLISLYLSIPLPYPLKPCSSTSVIDDPISMTQGPRTYPLFIKGAVRYRFEYGVFLLNKDIEILSNAVGIKVMDLRQTLPNLKYLLYVTTAGTGELPARKAGGIRGLLRLRGTPPLSRTGSMDSTLSGASREESAKRSLEEAVGARNGMVVSPRGSTLAEYGKARTVRTAANGGGIQGTA